MIASTRSQYPSAGGRLFGIGGMIEGWGFRFRRGDGSVHKLDYGHEFAGAASVMAGGAEAGDCCGLAGAGVIGIGGGAALRREREPGFCVAQALSRTDQQSGSSATGVRSKLSWDGNIEAGETEGVEIGVAQGPAGRPDVLTCANARLPRLGQRGRESLCRLKVYLTVDKVFWERGKGVWRSAHAESSVFLTW